MKIILTSKVKDKLRALTLLKNEVSGFIRGSRIGKYLFITDFLQVELNKENIDINFENIYKSWGIQLQGFFLNKKNYFKSEFFKEKIIMIPEKDCWDVYFIDIKGIQMELLNKEIFCLKDEI